SAVRHREPCAYSPKHPHERRALSCAAPRTPSAALCGRIAEIAAEISVRGAGSRRSQRSRVWGAAEVSTRCHTPRGRARTVTPRTYAARSRAGTPAVRHDEGARVVSPTPLRKQRLNSRLGSLGDGLLQRGASGYLHAVAGRDLDL